jgi:catechol 2,3-dioxygenase
VAHLVLNVRDIEVSHRFWTDVMGFRQVGQLENNPRMTMRFYCGSQEGHHHDLALSQVAKPDEVEPASGWSMASRRPGLNHMAINYPDRESWLRQLEHLQASGVKFHVRGDHGMSHSVYISDPDGHGIEVLYDLPEEVWGGDLNAALNYFKPLPTEGDEALRDDTEYKVFA